MAQQPLGGDFRIDPELLREIAEGPTQLVLLAQGVDRAEVDLPFVGLLQGGDGAHERRLAGAVRAKQAIHPRRDAQVDVLQCLDAVGVSFREVLDAQAGQSDSFRSLLRAKRRKVDAPAPVNQRPSGA